MPDLDPVLDEEAHNAKSGLMSDQQLVDTWVSRKIRNKPTWQMEREIQKRGIMDRCLKRLAEVCSNKTASVRDAHNSNVRVSKVDEVVQIKPGIFGVSLDIKALIRRVASWWGISSGPGGREVGDVAQVMSGIPRSGCGSPTRPRRAGCRLGPAPAAAPPGSGSSPFAP